MSCSFARDLGWTTEDSEHGRRAKLKGIRAGLREFLEPRPDRSAENAAVGRELGPTPGRSGIQRHGTPLFRPRGPTSRRRSPGRLAVPEEEAPRSGPGGRRRLPFGREGSGQGELPACALAKARLVILG